MPEEVLENEGQKSEEKKIFKEGRIKTEWSGKDSEGRCERKNERIRMTPLPSAASAAAVQP